MSRAELLVPAICESRYLQRIAEYNAKIQERNAAVAEQQAEQRIFMSKVEEGRLREDAVEFIADQQAATMQAALLPAPAQR